MVNAYNRVGYLCRVSIKSPRLIYSTARALLAKLGFSLRHGVEVFAVFIIFACLRPWLKQLKADVIQAKKYYQSSSNILYIICRPITH